MKTRPHSLTTKQRIRHRANRFCVGYFYVVAAIAWTGLWLVITGLFVWLVVMAGQLIWRYCSSL